MPRNLLFGVLGSEISFADKRKNGRSPFAEAKPSLFFLILTLL